VIAQHHQDIIDGLLNPLRVILEELRELASERHGEATARGSLSDTLRAVAAGEAYQISTAVLHVQGELFSLERKLTDLFDGEEFARAWEVPQQKIMLPSSIDSVRAKLADKGEPTPEDDPSEESPPAVAAKAGRKP
jgi:hypothetical protein